jgi:hypothetical protein
MLIAYPPEFRARYGLEMTQAFREQLREALSTAGTAGFLGFSMRMAWDFPISVLRERISSINVAGMCCAAAAVGFGLYAAYVDHHNATEVYPTLFVVLVGSFALGLIRPVRPWRWALIVVLGVPFSGPLLTLTARMISPGAWAILAVVLVPGFVGAYTGSFLRRAASALRQT